MLGHGKPPPRQATGPCHSRAHHQPVRATTPNTRDRPKADPAGRGSGLPGKRRWSVACRYGNINPFIHSTTPVGLALGPDSPRDDERGPGTLGRPAAGIFTPLSLLMSAFSLPHGPPRVTPRLHPMQDALLPSKQTPAAASSVACLSPATLSARNH